MIIFLHDENRIPVESRAEGLGNVEAGQCRVIGVVAKRAGAFQARDRAPGKFCDRPSRRPCWSGKSLTSHAFWELAFSCF